MDRILLARSAKGASLLIILQIGSRAITFAVNQTLLRFLSPELLGVSSQLELFAVTILTFARESLRVSLSRQNGPKMPTMPGSDGITEKQLKSSRDDARIRTVVAQEAVNMACLAPLLGLVLSSFLGYVYLSRVTENTFFVPYLRLAIYAYGIAAVLELLSEPCFAIASQQGLLSIRARAETIATICRCVVACGIAAYGQQTGRQLGALPFASGQLSYAVGLNIVYWRRIVPLSRRGGYSLWPNILQHKVPGASGNSKERYYFSRLAKPVLFLALNFYGQSVFKHFLTQGDAFLVSFFATLGSQGMYALASNYGSLLARMLFQPIEESSRGVFGSLLGAATMSSIPSSKPRIENAQTAKSYLETVLRLYFLLSVGIVNVGPVVAPLLLRLVAGKRWADTEAGGVLSVYCYYIPLLAFNGILEAFVAATATPSQLRAQSIWMVIFFLIFGGTGYVTLRICNMGAAGLIVANAVNMTVRITWSWTYMRNYFKNLNLSPGILTIMPRAETLGSALVTNLSLRWLAKRSTGIQADITQNIVIALAFGFTVLFTERRFLQNYVSLLRPNSSSEGKNRKSADQLKSA